MGKSIRIFFLFSFFSVWLPLAAEKKQTVSFNRDIRPILSSKCFHCHGPSEKSRKAKLRLDIEAEALSERDGIRQSYRETWTKANCGIASFPTTQKK